MFKPLNSIIMIIAALTLALSTTAHAVNITPEQWAVLKKGGIVKWLKATKGTEIKKGVVIGIINAPPPQVWTVVHENNNFSKFMPRMFISILVDPSVIEEAKSLKFDRDTGDPKPLIAFLKKHRAAKMTDTTGYFFAIIDTPWPATNRWYIIKLKDSVTKNRWFQHWNLIIGNLKINDGSWELLPFDNDKTLAIYTSLVDPGGMIPNFIINIGTNQTLPDLIRAVRKRVKKEFGKQDKDRTKHPMSPIH